MRSSHRLDHFQPPTDPRYVEPWAGCPYCLGSGRTRNGEDCDCYEAQWPDPRDVEADRSDAAYHDGRTR